MKCKDIYEWPESYGDPEWFIHDRFGMFIHFGLFSAAARHEWVMTSGTDRSRWVQKVF